MHDTKLEGEVNTQEDMMAIEKHLESLDKWANRNLVKFKKGKFMKFSKGKCKH